MLRHCLLFCLVAIITSTGFASESPLSIPVDQLDNRYQLVGKLHVPLGEIVYVKGVVVEGPFKGFEGGLNLRVQEINGKAVQEYIRIPLRPYAFYDWGNGQDANHSSKGVRLPKLQVGNTYEMEGYETGQYMGIPSKALTKAGVALQTPYHYFHTEMVVYKAKEVAPFLFRHKILRVVKPYLPAMLFRRTINP